MKTGPKYKIARRLGDGNIFSKTQGPKFALSESKKAGNKKRGGRPRGRSEYGNQLLEKQKVKYTYGISEKQLSNYVKNSRANKALNPTLDLHKQIEQRLDNVVYRIGLVSTRPFARQVVSHGHIHVNGRKVTIPSYKLRKGDVISIRPGSKDNAIFSEGDKEKVKTPSWIKYNEKKGEAEISDVPSPELDPSLNFGAVIEFYSRV